MVVESLLLLTLSAPPTGAPSHAETTLRTHCLMWAADPGNPWALAHGAKTFGPSFLASDGRTALEVVFHDFLLQNRAPDGGVGAGAPYGFLRYSEARTPIEPHTNLNLKAFVADVRMPLKTRVKTRWGSVTLGQLLDSTRLGFRHVPGSAQYWQDVGWTLSLFAATHQPGATWKTPDGTVKLDQVFDDALSELEKETEALQHGLDAQLPQVPKRKQGLYAHACGGLHFVQGVLSWARHPAVRKKWGARIDRQVAVHFYRLESERAQYDAALQETLRAYPQYKLQVLVQMVKFYGHWLETVAHFRDELKWKPDELQQVAINRARAYLDVAVRALEAEKAFEQMPELQQRAPQVYLDLIGDACHAAHGLAAFR